MADTPVTGVSDGVARVVTCAIVLTTVVEVLVIDVGKGAAGLAKRAVVKSSVLPENTWAGRRVVLLVTDAGDVTAGVVIDTLVKGVGEGAVAVVLKRAVIVAAVDTPVMSVGEGTADVRSLAVAVAAVLPVEVIQRSTFIGALTKKEHV